MSQLLAAMFFEPAQHKKIVKQYHETAKTFETKEARIMRALTEPMQVKDLAAKIHMSISPVYGWLVQAEGTLVKRTKINNKTFLWEAICDEN